MDKKAFLFSCDDLGLYPTSTMQLFCINSSQLAFTCSKLTVETLEGGVKYGQS